VSRQWTREDAHAVYEGLCLQFPTAEFDLRGGERDNPGIVFRVQIAGRSDAGPITPENLDAVTARLRKLCGNQGSLFGDGS
jgi:hypothetical protein